MTNNPSKPPLIIGPNQGRTYDMGRMRATFFADGEQTDNRYSISEWFLESRTKGPGEHRHPDDHILYVLTGSLSLIIEGQRSDAVRGSYIFIPGGTNHDFENHGDDECGFISINVPAGFEQMMPQLVTWFAGNPLCEIDA